MKKYIVALALSLSITAITPVFAETNSGQPLPPGVSKEAIEALQRKMLDTYEKQVVNDPRLRNVAPQIKDEFEKKRGEAEKELRDRLEGKKSDLRAFASTTRGEIKDKRGDFKDRASTTRGEIKDRKDDRREFASTTRGEIKDRREDLKDRASSTRAQFRDDVKKRFAEQAKNKIKEIVNRLGEALKRFDDIYGRIQSRIDKIKGQGGNTAAAEIALANAVAKISIAKASVATIATVPTSTDDPQGSMDAIRTAVETARKAVIDAKQALMDVMPALKGSNTNLPPVSTTTTP